jgi:hypothetical protein
VPREERGQAPRHGVWVLHLQQVGHVGIAAEAVTGVDAVVPMLWDGNSVAEVMTGALPAAPAGVLRAQASTVSPHDAGDRLLHWPAAAAPGTSTPRCWVPASPPRKKDSSSLPP